jgi:hypothetical protein
MSATPLLTTKRAHFDLGGRRSGRALERGECRVHLESLTDVLGTLIAKIIAQKTARAKQGAIMDVSPLLTTRAAQCRDLLEVLQD